MSLMALPHFFAWALWPALMLEASAGRKAAEMASRAIGAATPAQDRDLTQTTAERAAAYVPAGMEPGRLLLPANLALPAPTRLVVLVPNVDLDEAALARHIWKLAAPRQLAVLYLGWTAGPETEAELRRRLANLAALTRDEGVVVSARPATGEGWLPALRGVWRPGDLIVAHSELRVRLWGLIARPLGAARMPGSTANLARPAFRRGKVNRARPHRPRPCRTIHLYRRTFSWCGSWPARRPRRDAAAEWAGSASRTA